MFCFFNLFHNFTCYKKHNEAMKNNCNFIIWVMVSVIILSACGKDEGYEFAGGNHAGKQSYDYLENNIAACLSFFDLALRMNAYLELPEEEREELQDTYFPDYQVCRNDAGEWLGVKEQDTVFRIVADNLALTTESAEWKLDGCCDVYHGVVTIICTGLRNWTLEIAPVINGCWTSEAHFAITCQGEELPFDFNHGDWIIAGVGKSMTEEELGDISNMDFEIAESLVKNSDSKYLFDKGMLYIKIRDAGQFREEYVKAELKSVAGKGRQLQLTYKGDVYAYLAD